MRDLITILENVNEVNNKYRTQKLSFTIEQSEILRDLSCCYTDLVEHKRIYREQWLDIYNQTVGTNAHKEREADLTIKEYDYVKDVLKAVQIQIDCLRSTISANKN